MNWFIKIDERQFAREMARAFFDRLKAVLNRSYAEAVRARVKPEVARRVKAEPEYASLTSGQLRGELGVVDGAGVVEDMIEGLVTAPGGLEVVVDGPRLAGEKIDCTILASVLRDDYSEVLGRASASFTSKRGEVPWLRWLLLGGKSVILSDYVYLGKKPMKQSRTGMGIMTRSAFGWGLKDWGGSPSDNWLVRALSTINKVMADILQDELVRRF